MHFYVLSAAEKGFSLTLSSGGSRPRIEQTVSFAARRAEADPPVDTFIVAGSESPRLRHPFGRFSLLLFSVLSRSRSGDGRRDFKAVRARMLW